jgi:hypothetical protein
VFAPIWIDAARAIENSMVRRPIKIPQHMNRSRRIKKDWILKVGG